MSAAAERYDQYHDSEEFYKVQYLFVVFLTSVSHKVFSGLSPHLDKWSMNHKTKSY